MRFLLIGVLIVVLFVGSFFATFTVLEYLDARQQSSSSGGIAQNTPVPAPLEPTSSPVEGSSAPSQPAPVVEPAQPPAVPLSLRVVANQQQYRIGEFMMLTVSANQTCYLLLYDVDTQGVVARFFPNSQDSDSRIQANVQYQIPGDAEFDLEMTGPTGDGLVHAVCSITRIEPLIGFYQTRDEFDAALREFVYALPIDQWAETKATYRVVTN
jgi:hypothetical protein